jgi:hypothetical protein
MSGAEMGLTRPWTRRPVWANVRRTDQRDEMAVGPGGRHDARGADLRQSPLRSDRGLNLLTLASVLAEQLQLRTAGPGRLDRSSEQRLSEWMRNHVQVAVHPSPDRDCLRTSSCARDDRAGSLRAVTFDELIDFVQNRMSMSHVYQPLVIRALADADGAATLRQLAVGLAS